jgi:hypothetical protein
MAKAAEASAAAAIPANNLVHRNTVRFLPRLEISKRWAPHRSRGGRVAGTDIGLG